MPDSKFDLGDYVQVKDRIAKFYELFGQGRLVTIDVSATREPDDTPRIWVKAAAYRTPDDPLPGIGWSWLELPGKTSYTKGSELENAETSAWGRAIGALGILIDGSIATGNEVQSKQDGPPPPRILTAKDARPAAAVIADVAAASPFQTTEMGTVEFAKSGPADGELRAGPSGNFLVFRFIGADGKAILPQVAAYGPLAEALAFLRPTGAFIAGIEATVSGVVDRVPFGDSNRTFQRMTLARIERLGPDGWTLPAPTEVAPETTETREPTDDEQADLDAATAALWPDAVS